MANGSIHVWELLAARYGEKISLEEQTEFVCASKTD
jgi:hypothetical protein